MGAKGKRKENVDTQGLFLEPTTCKRALRAPRDTLVDSNEGNDRPSSGHPMRLERAQSCTTPEEDLSVTCWRAQPNAIRLCAVP